jgi:hypothetical protein
VSGEAFEAGRRAQVEGYARLEFANLPHDFAETLELVFVTFTIVISLGLLVVFGRWWQK